MSTQGMTTALPSVDIAVLGLGNMGHALADALLSAGHRVAVWNRTASRADALVAKGAVLAESPAAAIAAAPVSIMCLIDYKTAASLLRAPEVTCAIGGRTLVQLTSGLPEEAVDQAAWIHRHGGHFVAGGIMVFPNNIGKPDTSILFSGDEAAFATHRGVLAGLGGGLQFLGPDPGASVAVYITAGIYMLGSLAVFLEVAAVAESYGIPVERFRDFALGTAGVLHDRIRNSAQRLATQRFDGDEATIDMVVPTLEEHCNHFARAGIEPRLTAAFVAHLRTAAAEGRGHCDIAALIQRRSAGAAPSSSSSS
jgi:3-hydroxyisobutyrate dehydrogenase-like beta-hydroxyacid dehydrogenase